MDQVLHYVEVIACFIGWAILGIVGIILFGTPIIDQFLKWLIKER